MRICGRFDRHDFHDLQAIALKSDDLLRIVREETHFAHAEVEQDLRADSVVAQFGRKAELFVGFDSVSAMVLESTQ